MKRVAQLTKQQKLVIGGVGLFVILMVLIAIFINWQRSVQDQQQAVQEQRVGVILEQTGAEPLPLKYDLDQNQYAQAIEAGWEEARNHPNKQVLGFADDKNLMAFTYYQPGQEPIGIVAYKNQPVTVVTEPVDSLSNGQPYELVLERNNYQLKIRFRYTPAVSELDLPQVLNDAFATMLAGRAGLEQGGAAIEIKAIEELR